MKIIGPLGCIAAACALSACQGHLPPLETSPDYPGPKITDVIDHINCELSGIMADAPTNQRMVDRINADGTGTLKDIRQDLTKYNFVATAQLTLEVTDNEGINTTSTLPAKSTWLTSTIGGQLTGTQDRSLTINYAIDLSQLKASGMDYCGNVKKDLADHGIATQLTEGTGLNGGIAGDLGLADIVADGLLAMNDAAPTNVYGSSGPGVPVASRSFSRGGGEIDVTNGSASFAIVGLEGTLLFSPQASGISTAGSATLAGVATIASTDGTKAKYLINWTGSMIPPDSVSDADAYFTMSGTLMPAANGGVSDFTSKFGFSPTVTVTGAINKAEFHDPQGKLHIAYDVSKLELRGTIAGQGAASSNSGQVLLTNFGNAPSNNPASERAAALASGGASPSAKASASGGATSGGSSFGSLVDFTIVAGLNGGPSWSFKKYKGPAGTSPLASATRTNLDSLSITFVPSCQNVKNVNLTGSIYWDSITACDQLGLGANLLKQASASVGYENNSLMLLRNFVVHPAPAQ